MILEVLKYVLVVVGIIAVAALILWGLVTLILNIVEPHGNKQGTVNNAEKQITYQPQKLIAQEPIKEQETIVEEYVTETTTVANQENLLDVNDQKALEEEKALNSGVSFGELTAEEEEFIKEKQRKIEERFAEKTVVQEKEDQIDLDSIFIDDEDLEESEETKNSEDLDEDDEDIDALINRILNGSDENENANQEEVKESDAVNEEVAVAQPVVEEQEQVTETINENVDEEAIVDESEDVVEEKQNEETFEELVTEEEKQDQPVDEEITETKEDVTETKEEVVEEQKEDENALKIKELEEMIARQREEYEAKLQEMSSEKQTLILEKERIIKETESKVIERTVGPTLSLEEYEERLETLKERLKNNEKDLKPVKKEYIPLAKIKARLEKDNVKLRRKEALVAKQKVVLYGVNNYVDIDEEKAKKLAEDLDLLEGLRLSVQHCEEVMKANEERFPILETSYNSLIETNANIKADIEECMAKIAELKAQSGTEE